jgi:hypothetical protein
MNYPRLALAAVAATVADMVYGFVVYGNALADDFARFPGVFRPEAELNTKIPLLMLGVLLSMFAAAWIYAKGYEGGNGVQEGVRFGVLVGLFAIGYIAIGNYVVLNIDGSLSAYMAVAGLAEWIVVGAALGAVYKPATSPVRS